MSDISLTAHVTGGLIAGPFQMFNFTEMVVTGLKIVFEMSVIKETNVAYWQIKGYSVVDFVDFQIHTDSIVLNSMLDLFHFIIVQFFRAYEGGYGSYVAT